MYAEYVDDGFDIIVTMEQNDKRNVNAKSYFYMPYIVGQTFEALANSIDFEIDNYMDDCGNIYGIGESIMFGNDYGVYPFCVDAADTTSLYYLTPENLDELKTVGRTIIEAN